MSTAGVRVVRVLTQDVRLQRRLEAKRRARRRRFVAMTAALVGLGIGLFLGFGRGGNGTAKPTHRRIPVTINVSRSAAPPPAAAPKITRLALPATLPARTLSVPILMYHRIDVLRPTLPAITRSLTVDPRDFARQMRWLHGHGYHTVTQAQLFAALERGSRLPAKPVLITFDDGYRDVLANAAPVLRRLGMKATAYVITSRISNGDVSFLTWPQLKQLEQDGVEIGSHTVHHAELPGLSDPAALQELIQSRRALEAHLDHPVQWFAYPAGRFDARSGTLVRQAGYVLAATTEAGSTQDARQPFALHRYEVLDTTGVSGLVSLLRG
jgi:peptidoglycan/xylan/chitin deacetylase (PgdA/CDA1 family)